MQDQYVAAVLGDEARRRRIIETYGAFLKPFPDETEDAYIRRLTERDFESGQRECLFPDLYLALVVIGH